MVDWVGGGGGGGGGGGAGAEEPLDPEPDPAGLAGTEVDPPVDDDPDDHDGIAARAVAIRAALAARCAAT